MALILRSIMRTSETSLLTDIKLSVHSSGLRFLVQAGSRIVFETYTDKGSRSVLSSLPICLMLEAITGDLCHKCLKSVLMPNRQDSSGPMQEYTGNPLLTKDVAQDIEYVTTFVTKLMM